MSDKNLYNIYGKSQLKQQLDAENIRRITCSFYNYYNIKSLQLTRDSLYQDYKRLKILGRIYISEEGINAQFSIPEHNLEKLLKLNDKYTFMKNVLIKKAVRQGNSFLKLKILIKKEIVAWDSSNFKYDISKTGKHLNAKEFNSLLDEEDTVLIDVRNSYESEIGHFRSAILPKANRSKDLIHEIKKILKDQKDKKIAMYCTGGIRCEKASSILISEGFKKVYQLDGGVIEYANQVKKMGIKSKFIGKNFVFDNRLSEKITNDVIAQCHLCGEKSDQHTNCKNTSCHILFIQCGACEKKLEGCCSKKCRDFKKIPKNKRHSALVEIRRKFTKFRPRPSND